MKKLVPLCLLLALLLISCAQGAPEAAPKPEPTAAAAPVPAPVPTPVPTPEPTPDVLLQGQALPWDTRELILGSDEGLDAALPQLPLLERVDLSGCTLSSERMDELLSLRPDVDFLFTLRFGEWQVRSDITCFSTLRTGDDDCRRYTQEELYPLLRFCRHLRALDLGHNDLTDITLIGQLPELQVLILADNPRLADISPLGELSELRYIELFLCWPIEDFSCLYRLTKLQDLNMSYCRNLDDIRFIEEMPDFENGWFLRTGVTREAVEPILAERPGLTILYGYPPDIGSGAYGWRGTERNAAIRYAFTNWRRVGEWRSWDDVTFLD